MNVTLNKTDSVNAVITVEVAKADCENEVENSLKDFRKNAVLPGFRKGMIPPSLIRQKYGKSLLSEAVYKVVAQGLSDYVQENKLNLLGEPLPAEGQAPIDFDKQEDFVFIFDVGLSPTIDIKLTKDDKIPYYRLQVTEEMIDKQIEQIRAQFGNHELVKEIEDTDLVKGNIVELNENGEPTTHGIMHENAILIPSYMKNEEEKAKFLNVKIPATIIFNPYKAYEGDEVELVSFLAINKEEVKNYTSDFSFEITEVTRYKDAELNQELFDKVFEQGTIHSIEAFREKIKEGIAQQFTPESDYKFILDVRELLIEKASSLQFPDAFLKRWLLTSEKKKTSESIEEDYPEILKDLKFHLIREQMIEENGITVNEGELQNYAKQIARVQLAQYGAGNIPENILEEYAKGMLKKKETYQSLRDKILENKLVKILKEQVTLETKEITMEELQKLIK